MDSNNNFLSIISALTALIAVFVGPMITLRVSNKTIISPMRQAWINNLRDLIAEFLATTEKSAFKAYIPETDIKMKKARQKIYERLFHIESKISLMINPDETNHTDLLKAIIVLKNAEAPTMIEIESLEEGEPTNFELKQQAVIRMSRTILKEEWDVVKYG